MKRVKLNLFLSFYCLEYRDAMLTHCSLKLLGSRDPPTLASEPQPQLGLLVHLHGQLIFVFLVKTGFHHVGQAGLKLLTSGNLPVLASQSAESTDVIHYA